MGMLRPWTAGWQLCCVDTDRARFYTDVNHGCRRVSANDVDNNTQMSTLNLVCNNSVFRNGECEGGCAACEKVLGHKREIQWLVVLTYREIEINPLFGELQCDGNTNNFLGNVQQ